MSIEAMCNQALDLIGYKRHIGSIMDGSPAARVALNAYAETRDEVLAMQPWYFARDYTPLEPATPTPASAYWIYRFKYPSIAIRVLDVFPTNATPEELLDPIPTRWLEVNDRSQVSPHRGILTNFSPAYAAFTNRIIDFNAWPPEFTNIVIKALAEKFQRALVGTPAKEEKQ